MGDLGVQVSGKASLQIFYKHSNVIPLPKKGDNSDPSNFRPVSLLSNVGKLQGRIVFKHIYNFLHENDILYKYQSGFLPNHSTTFQLISSYLSNF